MAPAFAPHAPILVTDHLGSVIEGISIPDKLLKDCHPGPYFLYDPVPLDDISAAPLGLNYAKLLCGYEEI